MSESIVKPNGGFADADPKFTNVGNKTDVIDELEAEFPVGTNISGVDHFTAYISELEKLERLWNNGAGNLDVCYNRIMESERLKTWFYSVLCTFLYGCKGTNSLHVYGIPLNYSTPDPENPLQPVEATYLRIWKNKFSDDSGAAGDNDNNFIAVASPDEVDAALAAAANVFQMLSFSGDGDGKEVYEDWIGTCSRKYLLIPMKELKLEGRDYHEWKTKLLNLIEGKTGLSNSDKIILKVTADSIAIDGSGKVNYPYASQLLALVKRIIDVKIAPNVHFTNTIGHKSQFPAVGQPFFKLYCLKGCYADYLFEETLFVGLTSEAHPDPDKNSDLLTPYCTYPFTQEACRMMEEGRLAINDLSVDLDIRPGEVNKNKRRVMKATLNTEFTCQYIFDTADGVTSIHEQDYRGIDSPAIVYGKEHIICLRNMSTFFMYPNFPIEYEHKCKEFTYFSNSDAKLFDQFFDGATTIDLSKGNNSEFCMYNPQTHREEPMFVVGPQNPEVNVSIGEDQHHIKHTKASYCSHFISVYGSHDNEAVRCGCILNVTLKNADEKPALLEPERKVSIDLCVRTPVVFNQKFNAYVDFGSSSSCVKYKLQGGGAPLSFGLVKDKCTLRSLLVNYEQKRSEACYELMINIPGEYNETDFPSMAVAYNSANVSPDYYPYMSYWMPLTKRPSTLMSSNVTVEPSNKVKIQEKGIAARNPNIIITNICYMIVCNAIMSNCDEIWVVPSLPSKKYLKGLKGIWNAAIKIMCKKFDIDLKKFHCAFADGVDGQHFLYESIAISFVDLPVANSITVSVDIGDSTTDMTAIYRDAANNIYVCGYSSVNYAGKQLVKQLVYDIAKNAEAPGVEVFELILKGEATVNGLAATHSSLLNRLNVAEDTYDGMADSLRDSLYKDATLRAGKDFCDYWENCVVEMLGLANLNTDSFDWKIASDFIARYLFLMPVIRDFVEASIKLAGLISGSDVDLTSGVKINFYGGAGKGIQLINLFDSDHAGATIYNRIVQYFNTRKERKFITETGEDGEQVEKMIEEQHNIFEYRRANGEMTGVNVQLQFIPGGASKSNLVNGLSMLNIIQKAATSYDIVPRLVGAAGALNIVVDWARIDPLNYSEFNNAVHQNTLEIPFNNDANDTRRATENSNIVCDQNAYYKAEGGESVMDAALRQFRDYFNVELYGTEEHPGIIDNQDGRQDPIEALFEGFVTGEKNNMFTQIKNDAISGAAFKEATQNTAAYPGMLKHIIFMFVAKELLNNYCGKIPKEDIEDSTQAGNFKFGE